MNRQSRKPTFELVESGLARAFYDADAVLSGRQRGAVNLGGDLRAVRVGGKGLCPEAAENILVAVQPEIDKDVPPIPLYLCVLDSDRHGQLKIGNAFSGKEAQVMSDGKTGEHPLWQDDVLLIYPAMTIQAKLGEVKQKLPQPFTGKT